MGEVSGCPTAIGKAVWRVGCIMPTRDQAADVDVGGARVTRAFVEGMHMRLCCREEPGCVMDNSAANGKGRAIPVGEDDMGVAGCNFPHAATDQGPRQECRDR